MRARNIKPGLYKNEDLAECSVWARLIFPGLWMMADREGRLEDRPKRIKAELLPFDSEDVEALLAELARFGLIKRYEADGMRLIWIPGFSKHQSPHVKEAKSELPPCPDGDDSCLGSGEHQTSTVQAPDKHQTSTNLGSGEHPLIPDSGFRIPDCSSLEEKSVCVNARAEDSDPDQPKRVPYPSKSRPSHRSFKRLWQVYPVHQGEDDAWREWCKLEDSRLLPDDHPVYLSERVQIMLQECSRFSAKPPSLANWLKGRRWNDEPVPATQPTQSASRASPQHGIQPRNYREAQDFERRQEVARLNALKEELDAEQHQAIDTTQSERGTRSDQPAPAPLNALPSR